jgi:hypothetical protein
LLKPIKTLNQTHIFVVYLNRKSENKMPLQVMRRSIGLIIFFLAALSAFGQKADKPLVQFSGITHNADSTNSVVPYVTITNLTDHNVIQSNYKGYFSFVVHEQDSVRVTCVGFVTFVMVIPSHVENQSYTIQLKLKPQINNLPAFRVFPWATTEEFTKEFLTMKVADDDLAIARKNLSHSSIEYLERNLPRDGPEINTAQAFHDNIVNSHYYTNPLFNPFAWGSLINSISAGDKSRSADNGTSTTPAATTTNSSSSGN